MNMQVRLCLLTVMLVVVSTLTVAVIQADDALLLPDDLTVITPDTVGNMELIGHLPEMARPVSLAFAADMSALFMQTETETGSGRAAMFTWPDLQPVLADLPLETGYLGGDGLLFTPNANVVVSLDRNGDILFFRPDGNHRIERSGQGLTAYVISPDGMIAAGFSTFNAETGWTHSLCVITPFIGRFALEQWQCVPQSAPVQVVHFLLDGERLLSQTEHDLSLIDTNTGEISQTFNIALPTSGTMTLLPNTEDDLPTVFISQQDYVLSLNLNDGFQRTYANGQGAVVTRIIMRPDGVQALFLVRSEGQSIEMVWAVDVATKSVLARLPLHNRRDVGYSADGTLAFVNNTIYETENWESLLSLDVAERPMTFSPDGRLLVALNTDTWRFGVYGIPASQ